MDADRRRRFENIAAEVADPLQRYLGRRAAVHDAEDAYSETLLALWRRIDDVPMDAPLPWAYGVARKVLGNQRRSASRHLRLVERVGGAEPRPHVHEPAEDDFPEVREALLALPDSDQEVLALWAWEQLEPREIAVVVGATPNAISLRLARAKAKLAAELRRQNPAAAGQIQGEGTEEVQP
jgi:RNA polymerase sigma-70 factor (ECF subfamily)